MTNQIKKLAPKIWRAIQAAEKILLHFHPFPDPDSVGSALAMYHALRGRGKKITVLKGDSPLPEYLSFLPGYDAITPKNYLEINPAAFDLFLILDTSTTDRVSNLGEVKFPPGLKTVLIDHHRSAAPFADLNLIAPEYPATAQILYELFRHWKIKLTPDIAACLFLGIYTDTGGFKYPGVTTETFLAAAKLVKLAANFPDLIFQLENNNSPGQLGFEGLAFSSIEVIGGGQVALVALSADQLKRASLQTKDAQGVSIPNHLKSVKGWMIGALLLEDGKGMTHLHLRTRDSIKFDVSKLAVALGGGGHAAAAGATLKISLPEAKALFLAKLKKIYGV